MPDLFAGRLVIVTPTRRTRPDTVRDAAAFWTALGADVITMNPEAHDEALAEVSHLPHLLAAVIAQSTPKAHLPIAASGLARHHPNCRRRCRALDPDSAGQPAQRLEVAGPV